VLFFKCSEGKEEEEEEEEKSPEKLSKALGNVTIVKKGKRDEISDGKSQKLYCEEKGSNRRCSGQGDILTGCIATFLAWSLMKRQNEEISSTVFAAYIGCLLTRRFNGNAFNIYKRSMTTSDMIEQVGRTMQELFPC